MNTEILGIVAQIVLMVHISISHREIYRQSL